MFELIVSGGGLTFMSKKSRTKKEGLRNLVGVEQYVCSRVDGEEQVIDFHKDHHPHWVHPLSVSHHLQGSLFVKCEKEQAIFDLKCRGFGSS